MNNDDVIWVKIKKKIRLNGGEEKDIFEGTFYLRPSKGQKMTLGGCHKSTRKRRSNHNC